jgi:hypothetical protein
MAYNETQSAFSRNKKNRITPPPSPCGRHLRMFTEEGGMYIQYVCVDPPAFIFIDKFTRFLKLKIFHVSYTVQYLVGYISGAQKLKNGIDIGEYVKGQGR